MESLDSAKRFIESPDAQHFVERYMGQMIGILIEQVPAKIGAHERNCVQESLTCAIQIVAHDLARQVEKKGTCSIFSTLEYCLNKKKQFYKGSKGAWNAGQMQGLPDFRLKVIEYFRTAGGFDAFNEYMAMTIGTKAAPSFEVLHHVLIAVGDSSFSRLVESPQVAEDDALSVSKTVMSVISAMNDEELKKVPTDSLNLVLRDLQSIYDNLVGSRRQDTYEFYGFWRSVVLKMIKSPSLPLKLNGWEQLGEIVDAVGEHAPPPRSFIVSGAGATVCNGRFEYGGEVTADGYQKSGSETMYCRQIPNDPEFGENAGKKLTIFRCTMRSQQKWWFLSHADEEQPGTDRDVDYYQHKSKEHEEDHPPPGGWITCRVAGVDPPPTMESEGLLVPAGQEYNTLEHQLAKWAIENEIVENVLGDTTIHREVVNRSTGLVQFLASMCTKDAAPGLPVSPEQNKYCLQPSHLLFAWKTCTRKADAAVATEVYKLLVSILPRCPAGLAIPLLGAVRSSLDQPESESSLVNEVGEFSSLLASTGSLESKSGSSTVSNEVREAILNLLWALLTLPEASQLKSYAVIQKYVTLELQKDQKGEHRRRFLQSCIKAMSVTVSNDNAAAVDEDQALRVATLANFVLQACPRQQAEEIVLKDNLALPGLLFSELIAFLERKESGGPLKFRKIGNGVNTPVMAEENQRKRALHERLTILRFVYGLSSPKAGEQDPLVLSIEMIRRMWSLCVLPTDRELVMVFLASASNSTALPGQMVKGVQGPSPENSQAAAFTTEVGIAVFIDLFCSNEFEYSHIADDAYKSFQTLFDKLQAVPNASQASKEIALDAVWRVCLTALSDSVVSLAMRDLLRVYTADVAEKQAGQETGESSTGLKEGFGERILQCLVKVNAEIDSNVPTAQRSVQRCLRILNIAVGRSESDGYTMTSSALSRLERLPPSANYDDAARCLPHGMKGKACYHQIGITVKRTQLQNIPALGQNQSRPPSPMTRLSFFVHPLETLSSVKVRVATECQCKYSSVRPIQISGRQVRHTASGTDYSQLNIGSVPEDSVMDELGVVAGCELIFVIADRPSQVNTAVPAATSTVRSNAVVDLTPVFFGDNEGFGDRLFYTLLSILDTLTAQNDKMMDGDVDQEMSPRTLIWDLLSAMPTNASVVSRIQTLPQSDEKGDDAMDVESTSDSWSQLIDSRECNRTVYSLLTIDSLLEAAPEVFSILSTERRTTLIKQMNLQTRLFQQKFLESGGFRAVVAAFSSSKLPRRGNAAALRILKSCIFGGEKDGSKKLLQSLTNTTGLLHSLTSMVVADKGISSATIMDVLRFLRLLFGEPRAAQSFVALGDNLAERFLVTLLWREDEESLRSSAMVTSALAVRKNVHDLVLQTPFLCDQALPWLINAIERIDVSWEHAAEHFDVLEKLVGEDGMSPGSLNPTSAEKQRLAMIIGRKIASCPKPTNESELGEISTAVLCGCLKLLRTLVVNGGGPVLSQAVDSMLLSFGTLRWSTDDICSKVEGTPEDKVLVDLMGVVFDGLLSPLESSSVAICCDRNSRQLGFKVIHAAARTSFGVLCLVAKIDRLVGTATPNLRHRFGEFGAESGTRSVRNVSSKYSGLRNQGCTCYMNSVLQQLFMMPELKDSMCAAPLPSSLRFSGGAIASQGFDLVDKRISLQWDNGVSYDAIIEGFNPDTAMHTIRYCPVQIATVNSGHQQVRQEDVQDLPPVLPDEFVLSQGRPGKETGVFEIVNNDKAIDDDDKAPTMTIEESDDEKSSRHLLEQFQRTLIHLEKGSRGRCFDPRALVEACACLKLEFDVWQQNDASEFATKLVDRLEISLKKWAPDHFQYMDHTFGLKQTKQKICKRCSLKTNREEKLLNIDCQVRGNADIRASLDAMTEVELMEGSNQVFCDNCKEKTDTILRTAISTLPNMLILSLKRFDLDFNTFETVKLNSRCSFGQTLNMKPYTLAGMEEAEAEEQGGSPMDTDDDFEYKLAGVLVHAGVAQGGHYYSFIKDRDDSKWYRFDDEDVTPFDESLIETECFGGKVKKETKWPNGQVHTVEQEQYANALMLFYEKVRPTDPPSTDDANTEPMQGVTELASGYEAYEPDVKLSNATHRWQSFLFDGEFHDFLRNLIGSCSTSVKSATTKMLLNFVFDVLLYSGDRTVWNEWARLLEDLLMQEKALAQDFCHELARRCRTISDNWVRTYLLECPDHSARNLAVRVFAAAIRSCVELDQERAMLDGWIGAWKVAMEQHMAVQQERNMVLPIPCQLTGDLAKYEDPESPEFSCCGTIFSFLNVLLEAIPRCCRFHVETASLVRLLAPFVKQALSVSQVSARLVVLIARDRVAKVVRDSFPAVAVSVEAAQTQVRTEMLHADIGRVPNTPDYVIMLEAALCAAGLPSVASVPVIRDAELQQRGRHRFALSAAAENALSVIFNEYQESDSPGMGRTEIETYLAKCTLDVKIADLMAKYPTTKGNHGGDFLSLEGFLAYYRDSIQTNDLKLRSDLHALGFRPDLTRRSYNSRYVKANGRDTDRRPAESVAIDVTETLGEDSIDSLGELGRMALTQTSHLFAATYPVNEQLSQYLVATVTHRQNVDELILFTLQHLHRVPNDWNGTEAVNAAVNTLAVICSTPGEQQEARIAKVMASSVKAARNADYGLGILNVLRACYRARQSGEDWNFSRYVDIVRQLRRTYPVFMWMGEHRDQWSFAEPEIVDQRRVVYPDDMLSDDEEDSQAPTHVLVRGAGCDEVNGCFHQDGYFEMAAKFAMEGTWRNVRQRFLIFQCNVSNNTKHWYISIVPYDGSPGTASDIDFYTAPATGEHVRLPPETGWIKSQQGLDPPPTLEFRWNQDDLRWNEDEDENYGARLI